MIFSRGFTHGSLILVARALPVDTEHAAPVVFIRVTAAGIDDDDDATVDFTAAKVPLKQAQQLMGWLTATLPLGPEVRSW